MLRTRVKPAELAGAVLLLAGLAVATAASAQDAIPQLTGVWSGKGIGGAVSGKLGHQPQTTEPAFKDLTVTWTLTIDKQEGSGLIGSWSSPNKAEKLVGVIRPDNKTVLFVDEDTYFSAILRSENEMETCLQETGGGSMVATCYILKRP
ncbi:MAG: hypothetical protein FJ144_26115 [Deltaproteobacteria bacterium]|nr:hypothetical protein [Deltaproteobacteria bacterium]